MNLLTPYKPLTIAFIALGISTSVNCVSAANDARRPVLATEQAALPGTGPNPGDSLRAHDSFGRPLIPREALQGRVLGVPGIEPNRWTSQAA